MCADPQSQEPDRTTMPTPQKDPTVVPSEPEQTLLFTDVMNNLQSAYSKSAMGDISTSFCFISLLHLANEKGLVINKTPELTELEIKKDWTAEFTGEG